MSKLVICICLLTFNAVISQETEYLKNKLDTLKLEKKEQEKQPEDDKLEYERVYVEVGLVKPFGKLSNQFELSPSYGFWFRSKIKNDDFIDIGLNIMIPKYASKINLAYKDSLFSLDSKRFGGNLGFRFAKIFPFSRVSPRNNIEWHSGFGVATLFYDANHKRYFDILNDKYKKDTDETYDFVLATIFLSQGIKLNIKNVGIQINYQFTPYGLFENRIPENFGSQSIFFGIYYRQ
jgi:hypothetical protein